MSGMGTLHLEIKRHRMERDFNLKIRVYEPRVSYRETIRDAIQVSGECVRQTGTTGLFAKVRVAFEPYKGEESIAVTSEVKPDELSPLFIAADSAAFAEALFSGELGYPVMGVKARILGGEVNLEQSNEIAFEAAGSDAVHKALRNNMILLEPLMRLEVMMPEEVLGGVTTDLNMRRAEMSEIEHRGKVRIVHALAPLAELFDYADKVRSVSGGPGLAEHGAALLRPRPRRGVTSTPQPRWLLR